MKTLTKIALALVLFATALASHAGEWVNGYTRTDGTYVSGYYRNTPAPSYSTTPNYSATPGYSGSSSSSRDYVYRNPNSASRSKRGSSKMVAKLLGEECVRFRQV